MLVSELQTEVAVHLTDAGGNQVTPAQILTFIQSAARDYRTTGWLIRMEDDESLEITVDTPEYTLPGTYAYVQDVWMEEVIGGVSHYTILIPRAHWDIHLNGGVPKLAFLSQATLIAGRHLKLVGQKKPTVYSDGANSVDVGMESLLRERAISYAMMSMAPGNSELAGRRAQMSMFRRQLQRPYPPKDFRQLPGSKIVPGSQ